MRWGCIDPYGNMVQRVVTPGGAHAVLVADVPVETGGTLALRLGDWVGWLCVAALLALTVLQAVAARRATRQEA